MKTVLIIVSIVVTTGIFHAQTKTRMWELSFSGHIGSVSSSTQTTGAYTSSRDQEAETFAFIALRPGIYLNESLEVEPELMWTAIEGSKPSVSISGNLLYNFNLTQSSPFILAGYGIGNSVPFNRTLLFRSSDNLDVSLLNLGAGIKKFVSDNLAIRVEYRYQQYKEEYNGGYGTFSYTNKKTSNLNSIFFGFSIFFGKTTEEESSMEN